MPNINSIEQKIIFEKFMAMKDNLSSQYAGNNVLANALMGQDFIELKSYIDEMEKYKAIAYYKPVSSNKRVVGRAIVAFKKAIRKSLAWLIGPIVEQQTNYNVMAANAVLKQMLLMQKNNQYNHESYMQKQDGARLEDRVTLLQQNLDEKLETLSKQVDNTQSEIRKDVRMQINANRSENMGRMDKLDLKLRSMLDLFENKDSFDAQDMLAAQQDFDQYSHDISFIKTSYSQSGEDAILSYLLRAMGIPAESVTYLDLGANHAMDLSNTYYFYSKGAKGVLVEANPKLISELRNVRHRDIVLNKCIDTISGKKVKFYILNGDGLSTPDHQAAMDFCAANPALKIIDTVEVETITVMDIIKEHMKLPPTILNIDIEGKEIEIINSIDFSECRPMFIVAEMISYGVALTHKSKNNTLFQLLVENGYEEYAFTGINSIFIDAKQAKTASGR
jgi:FkbM family methyltransferase